MVSWVGAVLLVLLVVAAVTDLKHGKIHNAATYPAIAIALVGHTLMGGLTGHERWFGLTGAMIGLAVGFLPLLVAWLAGGVGGGDAKIMAAVGALTGWHFALATLFYGLVIAAVMAVAIMLRRRIFLRTMGRILRFVYLAFTPSRPAGPTTPDSPKVPFGLALCFGAVAALIESVVRASATPGSVLGI